jgi:RecB family endonuclease NucS
MIEQGFRVVDTEFYLGHGRVDIIGRDKVGVLTIVEVKSTKYGLAAGKKQVEVYRRHFLRLLSYAGINIPVRAIVISPEQVVTLEAKTEFDGYQRSQELPSLPTSREIYGRTDFP